MVKKIVPILTTGGVYLQYHREHEKYIDKIKKLYTIEHFGYNNSITIARGYKVYPKKQALVLPKFGIDEFLNNENTCKLFNKLGIYQQRDILNALKECDDFKYMDKNDFVWTGHSNDYQKLVIETVMDNYFSKVRVKRGISGVVLNLPTGHGKTFVAMAIMDIIKLPTLIVCPRIKVANQWYDLLSKLFPNVQVGVFHSMRKIDGDIVVGVVDSFVSCNHFILKDDDGKGRNVVKNTYDVKEFYKRWGLIVFDECHNYSTKVNSTIFRRIEAKYTLGLSATPNKGNFSVISQWNIGPILDPENIDDYIETYKREKTVPIFKGKIVGVKYHGPKEYTKNIVNKNNHIIPYKMLDQLMSDPYRLALINKKIIELCNKDYCTLIFSDRISYLRQIQESLKDNENSLVLDDIKDIHQVITGGATDDEMARAYKSSRVILTTYAFFMEGISIPRINAIIYATPRKSGIKQANGRCIRPSTAKNIKRRDKENNKERVIIDIIDWNISLKSQWYTRKKVYNSMDKIGAEFNIIMEEVNYDEIEL